MFATMRSKNRNKRMKNELGQGVDHLKRAATLAAQETSATVGPKFNAAVDKVQPAAAKAKDAASTGWEPPTSAEPAASSRLPRVCEGDGASRAGASLKTSGRSTAVVGACVASARPLVAASWSAEGFANAKTSATATVKAMAAAAMRAGPFRSVRECGRSTRSLGSSGEILLLWMSVP